jgi:hypothetical protein
MEVMYRRAHIFHVQYYCVGDSFESGNPYSGTASYAIMTVLCDMDVQESHGELHEVFR